MQLVAMAPARGEVRRHEMLQTALAGRGALRQPETRTVRPERSMQRDAAKGKALGDDLNRIAGTLLDKSVELDALGP